MKDSIEHIRMVDGKMSIHIQKLPPLLFTELGVFQIMIFFSYVRGSSHGQKSSSRTDFEQRKKRRTIEMERNNKNIKV